MNNRFSDDEFFKAGGTLDPDAPSYVVRKSDAELWHTVLTAEYCNVLSTRQMGKSSLKSRIVRHLRDEGIFAVTIDLSVGATQVSESGTSQWYFGLISHFSGRVKLRR